MKTEVTSSSWTDITSKTFTVLFKAKQFQPASFWIDYTKRHPQVNTHGRNHCERCKTKWIDFHDDVMTYFVMTDKGNKVICESCWNQIEVPKP